jgi:hypothetical protein
VSNRILKKVVGSRARQEERASNYLIQITITSSEDPSKQSDSKFHPRHFLFGLRTSLT